MRDPEIREGKLNIECSLPIQLGYTDAVKIELKNPRISRAALDYHPYFIFEYTLDITRKDPVGGTHRGKNKGIHIIDVLNGRFLSRVTGIGHSNPFQGLYEKDNQSNENQEAVKDSEMRQLIIDLMTIEPVLNDQIVLIGDYETNIVDDKISTKTAERKVLERVVLENTQTTSYYVQNGKGKKKEQKIKIIPRFSEIIINKRSRIYVPSWIINIKVGEKTYNRKALAASKTLILDEIYFCPKHFSLGKIWSVRKQTSAVCEICGGAFCDDHIFKINNSYYCEEHRSRSGT